MKYLIFFIGITGIIVSTCLLGIIIVYQFTYDYLTQIQIFKELWKEIMIIGILIPVSYYLLFKFK